MRKTAICTGFILLTLTGCTLPQRPTNVPLAAVIQQLREDFKKIKAEDPVSTLPLTDIEVVLKVSTENVAGIGAETSLPFTTPLKLNFTNQTTGTMENTVTIKFSGSGTVFFKDGKLVPMRLDQFQAPK